MPPTAFFSTSLAWAKAWSCVTSSPSTSSSFSLSTTHQPQAERQATVERRWLSARATLQARSDRRDQLQSSLEPAAAAVQRLQPVEVADGLFAGRDKAVMCSSH